MISTQHITKLTAVGLAVGAFAAPAASAMPFGGIPVQASIHRAAPVRQVKYSATARQLKAADLAPPPTYSRQDKTLIPSVPPQAPATVPTAARHANPTGTSDWTYVAIGAGGAVVIALLGVGGPLAVQRRRRPTGKPATAAA